MAVLLAACGSQGPEEVELPPPPDPAPERSSFFGINGQLLRHMVAVGELELLDRNLAEIAAGGLGFVRGGVDWRVLQPEQPTGEADSDYEPEKLDTWVAALARHRLRWQPNLGLMVPEWAADPEAWGQGCSWRSAPAEEHLEDYAAAFAFVASRYGRGGSFWAEHPNLPRRPVVEYEVWNEPNLSGFWCPAPDAGRYARLYAQAQAAIRAVDPEARVLFGGLSNYPVEDGDEERQHFTGFLEEAVAALPDGVRIDALAAHVYGPPERIFEDIAAFRATLDRLGHQSTPISYNEFGWAVSGDDSFSEQERTEFMREVVTAFAANDCGVIRLAPYSWVTAQENQSDREDFFGIAERSTGVPLPAGRAYLDLVLDLGELAPLRRRDAGICS